MRWLKYLSALLIVLQLVLMLISIYSSLKQVGVLYIGSPDLGIAVYPTALQIEEVGRYFANTLYRIFLWVIVGVVITLGIETVLGLISRFVKAVIGFSIPPASINTLIRGIIQILLIKIIVDIVLKYFGFIPEKRTLALTLPKIGYVELYAFGYVIDIPAILSVFFGVTVALYAYLKLREKGCIVCRF